MDVDYERIGRQHESLKRRGYVLDERPRSPWYNEQCLRAGATPRGIAQELDRDPHGSVSKVFNGVTLEETRVRAILPPALEGRLVFDPETGKVREPFVVEGREGELKLWRRPDGEGKMPRSIYVVGADVAAGTAGDYSSNSVAFVIDRMTGEQVCEWVSNSTNQTKFAYVLAALGRWFHDALIIPEANFAAPLMKVLVETIGYENVFIREVEIVGIHKKTNKPGFWMLNDDVKLALFEAMQAAMATGAFTPRSSAFLEECPEYEWDNGKIIHVGSKNSQDEGSKGKAHGDRVIGGALAWHACDNEPIIGEEAEAAALPLGCMAARLKEYDERQERENSDDLWEDPLDISPGMSATNRNGSFS
jgi:hypothetical protein